MIKDVITLYLKRKGSDIRVLRHQAVRCLVVCVYYVLHGDTALVHVESGVYCSRVT
jgi:hypothetical protein